jgi:hypothetical protein
MKRLKKRGDSPTQAFRRIGRRRRLPGEHRSERSEPLDIASASERSNGFQSAIRAERAPASGALKMAEVVAARLAPQGDTAHIHLRSASAAPVPRTNGRTQP